MADATTTQRPDAEQEEQTPQWVADGMRAAFPPEPDETETPELDATQQDFGDTTENPETEATTEAPAEDEQEQDERDDKPGREAAKYRRRLRETEAERDQLRQRVEATQRALVDTLSEAAGVRPRALWAAGTDLGTLLDDDGNVDPERVRAAAEAASAELGLRRRPRPNAAQGAHPAAVRRSGTEAMVEAIRTRR